MRLSLHRSSHHVPALLVELPWFVQRNEIPACPAFLMRGNDAVVIAPVKPGATYVGKARFSFWSHDCFTAVFRDDLLVFFIEFFDSHTSAFYVVVTSSLQHAASACSQGRPPADNGFWSALRASGRPRLLSLFSWLGNQLMCCLFDNTSDFCSEYLGASIASWFRAGL
jgi:hypothetical protein